MLDRFNPEKPNDDQQKPDNDQNEPRHQR